MQCAPVDREIAGSRPCARSAARRRSLGVGTAAMGSARGFNTRSRSGGDTQGSAAKHFDVFGRTQSSHREKSATRQLGKAALQVSSTTGLCGKARRRRLLDEPVLQQSQQRRWAGPASADLGAATMLPAGPVAGLSYARNLDQARSYCRGGAAPALSSATALPLPRWTSMGARRALPRASRILAATPDTHRRSSRTAEGVRGGAFLTVAETDPPRRWRCSTADGELLAGYHATVAPIVRLEPSTGSSSPTEKMATPSSSCVDYASGTRPRKGGRWDSPTFPIFPPLKPLELWITASPHRASKTAARQQIAVHEEIGTTIRCSMRSAQAIGDWMVPSGTTMMTTQQRGPAA